MLLIWEKIRKILKYGIFQKKNVFCNIIFFNFVFYKRIGSGFREMRFHMKGHDALYFNQKKSEKVKKNKTYMNLKK